jgi:ATP-dependent RNA helicase RhlE
LCDADEKAYLRDIEKLITKKIQIIDNHPFPLIDNNPVKAPKQEHGDHNRPRSNSPRRNNPYNRGRRQ